ncbi:putative tRNA pseudouridine synthase Pus10 [Anthonomus grandis grandis]|uniref:putative tRNA pseudouridine synthase Pus10 n=1 Tax=Anthonomus grandis grandis TaxID=2921223 RepID=UPI0021653DCD|nr:putative tRNA pseudouridine synthase Pus10 [Anthonomus grandis grandis]
MQEKMVLPTSEENTVTIINYLTELSCCDRCILRFLGLQAYNNEATYRNPKDYFNKLLTVEPASEEPSIKKAKSNVCPTCLGCFDPELVESFTKSLCSCGIDQFKYHNFSFNVSFPKCLPVRAHSMLLHLKQKFPNYCFGELYDTKSIKDKDVILLEQPHKIFRAASSQLLGKILGKPYHPRSNLSLLIQLGYEDDSMEVENLKNLAQTNKKKNVYISKTNIQGFLEKLSDKEFCSNFPVPPNIPDKQVVLEKLEVTAQPIYLGGRYLKFKRNVGQTPWVVDGVSLVDNNIQDIIFDVISSLLGYEKSNMTFTASGREDMDVRMLGTGRPFYIKIENPKVKEISKELLREIEKQVIATEMVAVTKLQLVNESELKRIKHGEALKKKKYKALCKTWAPNIEDVITKINNYGEEFAIQQLTVMRVLHRRTILSREKIIHKMSAVKVPDHDDLFELELQTQAGTYVKEFVHGDFERTKPNISEIVGFPTDLVALDCADIDLVWPEEDIGNEPCDTVTENE